jgi:hypothetical protein
MRYRNKRATAIYRNIGTISSRERAWNEEEDAFAVISQANKPKFIDALCDAMGIRSMGDAMAKETGRRFQVLLRIPRRLCRGALGPMLGRSRRGVDRDWD